MVTDHSEIAANLFDDVIDTELWLQVLEAPGTAPLVGRARGLAPSPATLAISGPRGVGKRALSSLVHAWSKVPGELVRVECSRLVARGIPGRSRVEAHVDEWFEAAAGGTLVVVDAGLLARESQLEFAARLPSAHGVSPDRSPEAPPAALGPRTEARVVLVLEAGGIDWLEPELRHKVAQHTELPPLEAHGADVAVVVRTVLELLAGRDGAGPRRVTADGLDYLQRSVWLAQAAGLMHTVMAARALVRHAAEGAEGAEAEINRAALAAAHAATLLRPAAIVVEAALDTSYRDAKETVLEQFEGLFFARVLERTQGNVSEAARQTGLDRSNFRRALRRARERAAATHAPRRPSSKPEAAPGRPSSELTDDATRYYDSATHRIESGVRWQEVERGTQGDIPHRARVVQRPSSERGPDERRFGASVGRAEGEREHGRATRETHIESGEALRPGVASGRSDNAPPARVQSTFGRR